MRKSYICKDCKAAINSLNWQLAEFDNRVVVRSRCRPCYLKIDRERKRRTRSRQDRRKAERYLSSIPKEDRPTACQQCGKKGKVAGHHDSYKRPDKVIYLCRSCHRLKHVKKTRQKSKNNKSSRY